MQRGRGEGGGGEDGGGGGGGSRRRQEKYSSLGWKGDKRPTSFVAGSHTVISRVKGKCMCAYVRAFLSSTLLGSADTRNATQLSTARNCYPTAEAQTRTRSSATHGATGYTRGQARKGNGRWGLHVSVSQSGSGQVGYLDSAADGDTTVPRRYLVYSPDPPEAVRTRCSTLLALPCLANPRTGEGWMGHTN